MNRHVPAFRGRGWRRPRHCDAAYFDYDCDGEATPRPRVSCGQCFSGCAPASTVTYTYPSGAGCGDPEAATTGHACGNLCGPTSTTCIQSDAATRSVALECR